MLQFKVFFIRWLVWLLVLTLESVVGLPWLSVFLIDKWFRNWSEQASWLYFGWLSLSFALVYSLPLTMGVLVVIAVWRIGKSLKNKVFLKLLFYLALMVFIMLWKSIPLNGLTLITSFISGIVIWLFLSPKKTVLWRKNSLLPSVKS